MKLAPYEKQLSEAKGQLNVNYSERDMLTESVRANTVALCQLIAVWHPDSPFLFLIQHEAARKQLAEAKNALSSFEPSIAEKETQIRETADALEQANSRADILRAEEKVPSLKLNCRQQDKDLDNFLTVKCPVTGFGCGGVRIGQFSFGSKRESG